MPVFFPFFASLALALGPAGPTTDEVGKVELTEAPMSIDGAMQAWAQLVQSVAPPSVRQVRIEQHIIWRVAPMPGPARESLTAITPTRPVAPRMLERKMGDCVPMSAIAGGRPDGNSRLLLFLRDRRLVAANLERACSARDFYRGFYIDKPNSDGRICADRDRILARSGARCEISSFRLLVRDN